RGWIRSANEISSSTTRLPVESPTTALSRDHSCRDRVRLRELGRLEPLDPLLQVWLPTHIPEAFLPTRRRGRVPSGCPELRHRPGGGGHSLDVRRATMVP